MTHDVAAHTHDSDPPPVSNFHPYSKWTTPIIERLKELHTTLSSRQIAIRLAAEFQINFSRNAVVGKLHRLGLTDADKADFIRTPRAERAPRVERTPRANRSKLTVVRVNGNSPNLKLAYSVERGLPALRVIALAPLNLSLADLPEDGCRYIAGEDLLYCGHPRHKGSSYCEAHHRLVWIAPTPRNQAARGWR